MIWKMSEYLLYLLRYYSSTSIIINMKNEKDIEKSLRLTSVDLLKEKYKGRVNGIRTQMYELRKSLRMNQETFAENLNLMQNYYARIENGEVEITAEIIYALMENYDLDWFELFYGDKFKVGSDRSWKVYCKRLDELVNKITKLQATMNDKDHIIKILVAKNKELEYLLNGDIDSKEDTKH